MATFESLASHTSAVESNSHKGLFANLEALACSTANLFESVSDHVVDIQVDKPPPNIFYQTDLQRILTTTLHHDKIRGEWSFVTKEMAPKLDEQRALTIATLVPYITRAGVVGLWPLKPVTDSRSGWLVTAAEAAKMASTQWVRMFADREQGAYRIQTPLSKLEDPKWPDLSLNKLLEMGFRDRIIDRDDHPVMNRLLGRV